jgi:hypothetical protein
LHASTLAAIAGAVSARAAQQLLSLLLQPLEPHMALASLPTIFMLHVLLSSLLHCSLHCIARQPILQALLAQVLCWQIM